MPQPRSNDPLRRAIRKLVVGLEKREHVRRERRRYNRQPLEVKVHLCTKVGNNEFQTLCEAWAVDLSMGGIGCLAEKAINREAILFVNFEDVLGHPCYVPVSVRRCQKLIGSIHQINGQFVYDIDTGPVESDSKDGEEGEDGGEDEAKGEVVNHSEDDQEETQAA